MQCNFCLLDLSNSVDSARSKVQHEKYYLLHASFLVLLNNYYLCIFWLSFLLLLLWGARDYMQPPSFQPNLDCFPHYSS